MILFSVCSRKGKEPKELRSLYNYVESSKGHLGGSIKVAYDAPSIYEGHQSNIEYFKSTYNPGPNDIIVFIHDDVSILSDPASFEHFLSLARKKETGFLGLAGAAGLRSDAIWWNSRQFRESRGFVFQGDNEIDMQPNPFGYHGQVVVLDGCFLACSFRTLQKVGFEKPSWVTSDWDFYDIGMTMKAHMLGLNNYTVPIICRHVSSGEMRKDWYQARQEFIKEYGRYLPLILPMDKTRGLPL